MDEKIKNYLGVALTLGIVFSVLAGFWYLNFISRQALPGRSFQVSGEGKELAIPDIAELSFGVLTEGGKNLAELQNQNSEKINKTIAFLKEKGIEVKDIKTQYYNISPRYQYFSCPVPLTGEMMAMSCPPSEIIGYSINQNVSVKIRDLNKVGDIVAGVVEKGVNTISGPSFTIDDPEELQNKARKEAIAKAKENAETVARSGGFKLGKLISIQEGISLPVPMLYERAYVLGKGVALEAPSIEPGSQEIQVTVTLVYEMK